MFRLDVVVLVGTYAHSSILQGCRPERFNPSDTMFSIVAQLHLAFLPLWEEAPFDQQ